MSPSSGTTPSGAPPPPMDAPGNPALNVVFLAFGAIVLAVGLFWGVTGARNFFATVHRDRPRPEASRAATTSGALGPAGGGDPFVASFRALRPSVVLFTMKIPSDDKAKAARGERDDAYGSGVVVASGSWGSRILTAEHVVHDATGLHVTVRDRLVSPCRVIASDAKADLAIVETSRPDLPVATLGDSRTIEPGMQVGVAGYPVPDAFEDEGLTTATSVFAGRVSSVRNDAIELDVPIIPGESGGPIFDASDARVIALAESRFDEERAIGFGIPIDDARAFLAKHPRAARVETTRDVRR